MVGGGFGVVIRVIGVLSGGISSGQVLQNPCLGSQAKDVGVGAISLQILVRWAWNSERFAGGMAQAPMWLALFPQSQKHFPLTHQQAQLVGVAPFGAITCAFPGEILRPILSFLQKEFLDEGGVLDHAIVVVVAVGRLPLPRILLLFVISG